MVELLEDGWDIGCLFLATDNSATIVDYVYGHRFRQRAANGRSVNISFDTAEQ